MSMENLMILCEYEEWRRRDRVNSLSKSIWFTIERDY